jgi:predicted 3-demethylubiquinone-9 3-methyltransferase (glyoxalase superfamily)
MIRYDADEESADGTIKHAVFSLNGQDFMVMDSNRKHNFTYTICVIICQL